jgi:PAS domain S-box-containing protein
MPFDHLVLPSAGSLSVAVVAAFIFILQIWFSTKRADFRWWRWTAAVSFSTILYAAGILLEYNAPEGPINRFGGLLEWTAVVFLVHALYGFVFSRLNIPSRRYHLAAGGLHVLILILLWSTNIFVSDHFVARRFLTLEKPFVEADLGPLGPAFMLYALGASINAIRLWIVKGKEMEERSRAYVWGASFWILLGAHDAALAVGFSSVQYVMEYGFLGFSAALFYTMFSEYLRTSDALAQSNVMLRKEMETRNRLEDALRKSEQQHRNLVENINDVIYAIDLEGNVTYISPVVKSVMGYTPSEIVGRHFSEFIHNEDLAFVMKRFEETLSGHLRPWEYRLLSKSGEYRWVRSSSRPIVDDHRVTGLQGMFVDITKRKKAEEALKESETRYRMIINNTKEGIILQDASGRILTWNQTAERVFGISEEDAVKHTSTSRDWNTIREDGSPFPGSDHPSIYTLSTGKSCENVVMGVKSALGGVTWININTNPLFRENDSNPNAVVITFADITVRKRAEEALQEKSLQVQRIADEMELIIDGIPGLVFFKDTENRFIRVNKFVADAHQRTKKQLEGTSIFELYPREMAQAYFEDDLEVIRSRRPKLNIEEKWETADGTRWLNTSKIPHLNEKREVTGVIGFSLDITERKKAEEAVRESEEKYRSLVESTDDSIYLVDRNCAYLFMNKIHLSRFGVKANEVIGRRYDDYHSKDETKEFKARLNEVIKTGKSNRYVYQSERAGGHYLRTLSPVKDLEGNIAAVTVISKDITERIRAEEDLRQTNEELSREHNQRKILSRKLIDLLEKDRRQVAMELHDHIGQILTSLKMDIEMIHRKLKPENRTLEARITAAQERTIQALRDIKNISQGLRPAILDALGLIPSLRDLFNEIQQQTDIEIRFFSRNVPKRLDSEKELAVFRIAQEATTNIIKYAVAKEVFVNLVRKGEELSLSIEDDGIGFDPYETMKTTGKGLPLGLLIMRERAEQLGGEFTLDSQAGKGTRVMVEIPI